jgi:hypothetical protein
MEAKRAGFDQDEIERIASELESWVQSAVVDLAQGCRMLGEDTTGDDLYEDVDTLRDLLGDRIYDAGAGDWGKMIEIAKAIRSDNGWAIDRACDRMIRDWKKVLKRSKGGV